MNKPEHKQTGDGTDPMLRTITETMADPGFAPEQLPELWYQITEPDGTPPTNERHARWIHGIGAMYRRCETYVQHTQLSAVLSGMPDPAWHGRGMVNPDDAGELLEQATAAQLQQALKQEQEHPERPWKTSDHLTTWANAKQLTGPVIDLFPWQDWFRTYAATPDMWIINFRSNVTRHIVEHVQHRTRDNNAWEIFLGVAGPGTLIGPTIELANTLADQPGRTGT